MGKSKPLSLKEIRERQREAGLARTGPRAVPEEGDAVTEDGFRVPGRYKGSRHVERNREIVQRFRDGEKPSSIGKAFGISPKTVDHIQRYFVEPEDAEEVG